MAFLDKFLAGFTEDEQQSEIVKRIGDIGQVVEKALLEDLNYYVNSSTEIAAFNTGRIQSWLSFFLCESRNVTSAEGVARVVIPFNTDENLGEVVNADVTLPVVIPEGSEISTVGGPVYTTTREVRVNQFGQEYELPIVQGQNHVSEGTYDGIICMDAAGVDMSSVEVRLNGSPVSRAQAVQDQSLVPYDGYHAFVHNDKLYVKVFRGPNTPEPSGCSYRVAYRTSDGLAGNITSSSGLKEFATDLLDSHPNPVRVDYTLLSPDINNGRDAPTRYELLNKLREHFWITTNVASIPEYTAWFRAQEGVGDVLVLSDYEKWRRKGDPKAKPEVTGVVTVYLMDNDGNPLTDYEKNYLDNRLAKVRDIAIVEYADFSYVMHSYQITYLSSSNPSNFEKGARAAAEDFYSPPYLRDRSLSLFEPLNVNLITRRLLANYDVEGLDVRPFHSKRFTFRDNMVSGNALGDDEVQIGRVLTTGYYDGETFDGFYEWDTVVSGKRVTVKFKEIPNPDGKSAKIYQLSLDIEPVWAEVGYRGPVDDLMVMRMQVSSGGSVIYGPMDPEKFGPDDLLSRTDFKDGDVFRCYWPIKNRAVATINSPDCARRLMDVRVQSYGSEG